MIDRRTLLVRGSVTAAASFMAPRMAFARADTDQRFVFIIQRGAADGLGIVGPIGDPAFTAQRGDLATDFVSAPKLDGTFALHPAMAKSLALYKQGQALFAHAVASPYRDRSHFDGQNILETGGANAYQLRDGWMNRMLGLLPSGKAKAVALAATVPMALRGSRDVTSYAPTKLPDASDDLLQRVSMLYQGDSQLHDLWSEALSTRELTGDLIGNKGRDAAETGALAARLLRPANGARVAMIETGGWDTHAQQRQRLRGNLIGLDAMIGALQAELGPAWSKTTVLVATEFGRTVRVNGTGGTDHGTGAVALLLGGAVRGGRVIADWPGIASAQLYENRDLRPTTELDAFIAGAVANTYGMDPAGTMKALFPGGSGSRPVEGLLR